MARAKLATLIRTGCMSYSNLGLPSLHSRSQRGCVFSRSLTAKTQAFMNSSEPTSSPRPTTQLHQSTRIIYNALSAPEHCFDSHLERPQRVTEICHVLKESGLLPGEALGNIAVQEIPTENRKATKEEIALVHHYFEYVDRQSQKASKAGAVAIADVADPDGATYVTPSTFNDALKAVRACLDLVDLICTSEASPTPTGFSLIRPPGHHATPSTALGFCIFNNIAIAARYAQQRHGMKKILILDFDVHNGNGTVEAFFDDPSVFVVDIFERTVSYPAPDFIPCGMNDIGEGAGRTYTAQVPFPQNAGEQSVLKVVDEIFLPLARRFRPDMILVSAGYDGHVLDPLAKLQYRSSTYYKIAKLVQKIANELCNGRLLFVLEGGYDLKGLSEGVKETWLALLGHASQEENKHIELPYSEPLKEVEDMITELKQIHGLE